MEGARSGRGPSAEEVEAYVGPKAGMYRGIFTRFTGDGEPEFAFSWNWPAFFCGTWWYLYRKMYLWAAVDFVVSVLFGWTFFVPLLWMAARAVTGDYLYYLQVDRKVRESRPYSPGAAGGAADPAAPERLAREGGVHRWVAWAAVAGILVLVFLSSLFFWILREMLPFLRDHWPPPQGIPV